MAAGGADYTGFSAENYGYGQMPGADYGGGYGAPRGGGMAGGGMPPNYGYGGGYNAYQEMMPSPLDAEIAVVCREIHTELQTLEAAGEYGEQFKNAKRLLTTEANKLENMIDPEWLEVDINKPIKVTKKVLIPSFRHPKFNFVGKVLGPKGTTLQNIAKQFKCHVYILGRGSTRDRAKEQELLASGDPQFAHYGGPLHVKVETTAPPAIAYKRVAGVLEVLSQLLVPIKDTNIEGITTSIDEALAGQEGGNGQGEAGVKSEGQEGENGGGPDGGGAGPSGAPGAGGGYQQRGGGGFGGGGGGAMRGYMPRMRGGGGGQFRGGGGYNQRGGGGFPPGGGGGPMMMGRGRGGPRPGYAPY